MVKMYTRMVGTSKSYAIDVTDGLPSSAPAHSEPKVCMEDWNFSKYNSASGMASLGGRWFRVSINAKSGAANGKRNWKINLMKSDVGSK